MGSSLFQRCVRKSRRFFPPEETQAEEAARKPGGDAALDRRGPRSALKATRVLH